MPPLQEYFEDRYNRPRNLIKRNLMQFLCIVFHVATLGIFRGVCFKKTFTGLLRGDINRL